MRGYKVLKNKVVKKLRTCKTEFYAKLYADAEMKKTTKELFKITREIQDSRDGNAPKNLLKDGKLVRKPVLMANLQLDYYVTKIRKIVDSSAISNRNPI